MFLVTCKFYFDDNESVMVCGLFDSEAKACKRMDEIISTWPKTIEKQFDEDFLEMCDPPQKHDFTITEVVKDTPMFEEI